MLFLDSPGRADMPIGYTGDGNDPPCIATVTKGKVLDMKDPLCCLCHWVLLNPDMDWETDGRRLVKTTDCLGLYIWYCEKVLSTCRKML